MKNSATINCELCNETFEIPKYGSGVCPNCKQVYTYNSDCYKMILEVGQKTVLRALRKEER
jgi:hypothetical protein